MQKGISVVDPATGEDHGKSKLCAKEAVMNTSISRIFLNVTIFIPPICLVAIEKVGMMPVNFYLKTILEAILIAGELYLAVPTGIAMFPQTAKIQACKLEEEFQQIKDSNG